MSRWFISQSRTLASARSGITLCAIAVVLALSASASARTIVLTDEDCELMAAISATAPRLSWAGSPVSETVYTNDKIDLNSRTSFLIRYPLERIPQGQVITKAEWIVPYVQSSSNEGVRLQVRRLLKDWGIGVSHDDRMARPDRLKWHTPGARGVGQDRAAKATAVGLPKGTGEYSFNVTEDVELWYTKAAPHYGWILTCDDQDVSVRMASPFGGAPKGWKLKITFEPE